MKHRKTIREMKDIGRKAMARIAKDSKKFYKYLRNRRKMIICRGALFIWRLLTY